MFFYKVIGYHAISVRKEFSVLTPRTIFYQMYTYNIVSNCIHPNKSLTLLTNETDGAIL